MSKTLKIVAPVFEDDPREVESGLETFIFDVAEVSVYQQGTHCFVVSGKDGEAQCVTVAGLEDAKREPPEKIIGLGVPAHRMHYSATVDTIAQRQKDGHPIQCKYFTILLKDKVADFLAVDGMYQVYLLNEQGDTMHRLA